MKYRHIGMAVLFLIAYFGVNFLIAYLGFDPIVSTIFANVIISVFGLLYMRRMPVMSGQKVSGSYVFYITVVSFFVWLFSQITATYFLSVHSDVGFDVYQDSVAMNPSAFIVLSVFVAPVAEEILMRGVVYRSLKQVMPIGFAYAISAVLFALFHGTLVHIVIGIVCGILFAVVYEYTGDIKCNILLHVFYNSLSIFLGGIVLPEFLFLPVVFGVFDIILVGIILYEIVRVYKSQCNGIASAVVNADAKSVISD